MTKGPSVKVLRRTTKRFQMSQNDVRCRRAFCPID